MSTPACVEALGKSKPEPSRDRVDLRIDPKIRERIERQCDRFGLDLSAYIRLAIVEKLERDEATDPELTEE